MLWNIVLLPSDMHKTKPHRMQKPPRRIWGSSQCLSAVSVLASAEPPWQEMTTWHRPNSNCRQCCDAVIVSDTLHSQHHKHSYNFPSRVFKGLLSLGFSFLFLSNVTTVTSRLDLIQRRQEEYASGHGMITSVSSESNDLEPLKEMHSFVLWPIICDERWISDVPRI